MIECEAIENTKRGSGLRGSPCAWRKGCLISRRSFLTQQRHGLDTSSIKQVWLDKAAQVGQPVDLMSAQAPGQT
jgi:hypothetical protein